MTILRTINVVLMIAAPFIAASYFINRFKSFWRLWWIGGAIFVISQLGHIPFNYFAGKILNQTNLILLSQNSILIINALFLGLSAGFWEETSRYFGYKFWLKKPKAWNEGIIIGLGHGSLEAIILGFLAFYVLIQMIAARDMDLSTVVALNDLEQTYHSIRSYWSANWFDTFLPFIERLMTIPIHVALSIMIVQIFKRENMSWFWLAVLFHSLVDTTAVLLISYTDIYITELFILVCSAFSIGIVLFLKRGTEIVDIEPITTNPDKQHKQRKTLEIDESSENLDDSKYY